MEGAEITSERLDYVLRAHKSGRMADQVFCAYLGDLPREDFIPYVADFFLQLEDVKWTVIAGVVADSMSISVRNLGYSKNAGEFVRRYFADLGSAGGHRAMAKAVVPLKAFREKFGEMSDDQVSERLQALAQEFLSDATITTDRRAPRSPQQQAQ
jgi:nanoRNase/pAp phosphatase (c-di-AMP/oligoRNAs hydrolase)